MELIRELEWGSCFTLRLFDTFTTDSLGKCRLAYELYHKDKLIFKGDDFCCSPMHAIDSDECTAALLGFLSMGPGDVDPEYFNEYTKEQLNFVDYYGEDLYFWSQDLEGEHDEAEEDVCS